MLGVAVHFQAGTRLNTVGQPGLVRAGLLQQGRGWRCGGTDDAGQFSADPFAQLRLLHIGDQIVGDRCGGLPLPALKQRGAGQGVQLVGARQAAGLGAVA